METAARAARVCFYGGTPWNVRADGGGFAGELAQGGQLETLMEEAARPRDSTVRPVLLNHPFRERPCSSGSTNTKTR